MTRLLLLLLSAMALAAVSTYRQEIADWRKAREAELQADGGWLSVAGLFWLHEGSNEIRGVTFDLHGGVVTSGGRVIKPDSADVVNAGRLSLFVIKRGDKYGIRLKDPDSEYRRNYHGIDYFPPDESYRVTANWVGAPRQIPILNVLGQTEPSENPGYAVFHLHGKELRLYPILEEPGAKELFYIFRDETTGKETYPAGRFLYSAMPSGGTVTLDFNKAYNPPCAFTPYATCPLPPKENHLTVRIAAGEKTYH